jgi:hypothetical protein
MDQDLVVEPSCLDELHELLVDALVGLAVALADDVAVAFLVISLLPAVGMLQQPL